MSATRGKKQPGRLRAEAQAWGDLAVEVFGSHPHPIVVLDRGGAVIARNLAAEEAIPGLEPSSRAELRCCDLVGCGMSGTPLAGACISELVAAVDAALPEIRVDLPEGASLAAAWVTAAPLGDAGHVMLHLRPGHPRDRRRRTEPHWIDEPRLRIVTLGHMRVDSVEGPIGGKWLEQRPGEVLKYIVTKRHRVVHSDEIAGAIWPHADVRTAANVRHAVHVLRNKLHPARESHPDSWFLVSRQGGYMLDMTRVDIDADDFEEKVDDGLAAVRAGDDASARELLDEAVALYGGDFLADEPFAEWCLGERDRLRDLASKALRALVDLATERDDLESAAAHLQRLADMYPFDSDVHRDLIAMSLRRGRRSEAMRRYTILRKRLRREFNEDPEFALTELTGS
jgi:DNA-binding SARP family transcriptional activator